MPTPTYPLFGASGRRWLAFFFLILGALVASAQTLTLTQVRNTGPRDRRINIVFVAEAFTAAQEAEFNRQAEIIGNMFVYDEGFGRFADHINLFRLFVPSNQAGPDERDRGIFHDTYFNSYLNGGMIGVDDGTVAQYQRVLAEQIPDYDIAIMLINMESAVGVLNGLGAVGNGIAWVTTRPADLDLIGRMTLHEAGHAFAALRDEYVTTTPAGGPTPVINAPNVSSESARDRVAWSRFIFPSTPTPTTDGWYGYLGADAVGIFPRALNRLDLYRATSYSRMNNVDRPWGPVNLRAIATAVHRLNLELATTPPTITRQPVGGQIVLGTGVTLTVAVSGTGPITYQWMRDGIYLPDGHRAGFEIPVMSKLDAGTYSVEVTNSAGTTTSLPVTLTFADGSTGHWDAQDIGAVGLAGQTIDADWRKTLRGSGADIGGTADAFHYAYQTLTGDGKIDVRITSLWLSRSLVDVAKAGVMMRESLQPNARHAALLYEWTNGGVFQYRSTTGGASASSAHADPAAAWLRITRSGDLFTGYVAKDDGIWQMVGSVTIPGMPATLYVGLAATSHDTTQILTAEFYRPTVTATAATLPGTPTGLSAAVTGTSQITLNWTDASSNETGFEVERAVSGPTGQGPYGRIATLGANSTRYVDNALAPSTQYYYRVRAISSAGASAYSNEVVISSPTAPPPGGTWLSRDIGAVAAAGSVAENSSGVTLHGSGADIWDRADEFFYRYQAWNGDGEFIAQVSVFTNTHSWAKAGLMIRESIAADSRHAFMNVSAGHGTSLQSRATTGGETASTPATESGGSFRWLRLVRSGNTITGYASADGTTWTPAGSVTIAMPADVLVGLAVTSHNDGMLVEADFSSIVFRSPNAPPPPPPPLNPPSALSVIAVSATQINLAWSDTNPDEDGVEIQRSTDGTNFTTIATAAQNATNYANTGLAPHTRYTYRVRATRGADRSDFTNTGSDTTFFDTPVAAPSALTATAASETRINLAWTDNSNDETGFEVQRSNGPEFISIFTASANVTTFSDSYLTNGTTYTYRVRAVRGPDVSGFTNTATATTAPPTVSAPTNLSATPVSPTRIDLSWTDPSNIEDSFRIERSTGGGPFAQAAIVGANVTSYSDTTVAPGTTYVYRVRANYGSSASGYSNEVTASTPAAPPPPPSTLIAPSSLTATPNLATRITLNWTDNSTDEDGFEIERSTDGITFAAVGSVAANTTLFRSDGLSPSTSYTYRVRATRGTERSAYSNPASATTLAQPPPAPTNLTATAISSTRIDLNWTDPGTTEDGFRIERVVGADSFAEIATVGANVTTFSDTSVTANVTYEYRVRARYGTANSEYSNQVSATPPAPPPPPPPPTTDWLRADIGAVGIAGSDDLSANPAVVRGSGSDIWEGADAFHFVYRSLSGDGAIVARVTGLTDTNSWAKAGVMIRESLAAGARNTFVFLSAGNGLAVQNRAAAGGATTSTPGPWGTTAPQWVRLTRTGNTIMAERSADGSSWTPVTSFTVAFPADALVGLAVTSHNNGALCNATFTGVSISGGATPTAPAAPTDLTTTSITTDTVTLGWTDASTNETGFQVERANENASFALLSTTAAGVTSFRDTGLTASGRYSYRVRAINSAGASAYSNTLPVQTLAPPPPPPTAPAAPTNLSATATSPTAIALGWTDASANETGFEIYRSSDNVTFVVRAAIPANSTTYTDTGLTAATTYYYRVRAVNGVGPSAYSNTANARTNDAPPPSVPPEAPTNLGAQASSSSAIHLFWTDASANETGFEIERSTDNVTFAARATTAAGTTQFDDTGLAASTTYYYRIRAVNAAGASPYSNTANAQTPEALPPRPAAPTGLSATATSSTQIALTWTDASNNETGFEIERSRDNVIFATSTVAANVTSFSDTGLEAATTYYYRVRAVNGASRSDYSNLVIVRTADAPTTWQTRDIGAVGRAGSVAAIDGGIALTGSGEDIWNAADEFRYYYQSMTGDGELIARVTSLTNTNGWAKAGVMFRESLNANAAHAFMCVSIDHGTSFQYRAATGGDTATSTPSEVANAIRWLRLVRTGNSIAGYESENGTAWTLVMSRTFAFPTTIYVGLAVTSHNDGTNTTANFTNIALTAGSAPPPPPPVTVNAPSSLSATAASSTQINLTWTDNATNETGFEIERGVGGGSFSSLATIGADRTGYSDTTVTAGTSYSYRVRAVAGTVTSGYSNTASATPTAAPPPPPPTTWSFGDIGGVGVSGSNSSDSNTITVRGSGSDIWERADSFRFVYRAMTGDGIVEAQVSSLQNTNGWAKAGVMIRESLAANSSNAAAFVSVDHGVVAQTRGATNAETQSAAGPSRNAPCWLRLTRSGTNFTAASSPDGVTWTTFATFTIPMNATAYFGFAVTSHDNSQLNTAVFTDPSVH